jgi:zinc D-Ala-D-Ala carboxypeptidase
MKINKRFLFAGYAVVAAIIVGVVVFLSLGNKEEVEPVVTETEVAKSIREAEEEPITLDISSASSVNVLVNKQNGLSPQDYRPADLVIPGIKVSQNDSRDEKSIRRVIQPDLEMMIKDSIEEDLNLVMNSGFRSFELQSFYFNNYIRNYGEAEARKFSAEPGHSEHQTGLSFDLSYENRNCYLEVCFGKTPAGIWLANNSYKYGFILRYPEGKEGITGYQYEPWHFRFVGKEIAKEIFEKKITYEEYLASLNLIAL